MPEARTLERARKARRQGKSASSQAGEFVREEIHHVREGKHGARSTKQAIAIGLSKARRAGVKLAPPEPGEAPRSTRKRARADLRRGRSKASRGAGVSRKRSLAGKRVLQREGRKATSRRSLAAHARRSARRKTAAERSASARKGARTRARRNSQR